MTQDIELEIHCPVCSAEDSHDLPVLPKDYEYGVEIASDFGIRVCDVCSSEFVWPHPSLDELRRMYPDNYYAYGTEMGGFWQTIYDMWCKSEAKRLLSLSTKRPLHLFSRESLELLLHKSDFRDIEIVEELNLFPALTLQNFLLGKLGLPFALEGGHTRIWTLLVFVTAPLSIFDYLFRRSDCMIFSARK